MSDAINSPIRLDGCRLCRLVVEADPCSDVCGRGPDFELGFDLDVQEIHPTAFAVLVGVRAVRPDDAAPQSLQRIEVTIEGRFSLPPDTPDEVIAQLVPLNCFAMLYGVARGIVAQATGLTPDGCVWLPSVNFVALLQGATRETEGDEELTPRTGSPRKQAAQRKEPPSASVKPRN